MNAAHLHILLVHIPVILVPAATGFLAVAMWQRSRTIVHVALSLFIAATVFGVPAFLVGEGAEEIVEHLPGVSEDTIEEHEEAADLSLWLCVALGSTSVIILLMRERAPLAQRAILRGLLIGGVVSSGSLSYTAYQGGKIRHPEAYDASPTTPHLHDHDGEEA